MSFGADDLLDCYRRGVFPMAEDRDDPTVRLIEPPLRGVIPLERFHVSRRLARRIRGEPFEVRIDTAFQKVVAACAAPGRGREDTWISRGIERLYGELYARGNAHSVECWKNGALAGGLYGVSIGGAFFGESMFSRETDASKVALAHLVYRLLMGGYMLLDAQFTTEHLAQFGIEEVPRDLYRGRLAAALRVEADFYRAPRYAPGEAVLQAISQRS